MMRPIITIALKKDLADILSLQKLAYRSEGERYNDFNILPLVQTIEEIESEFGDTVFLKLTINDTIVGSIKGKKINSTCHIGRLMVHPDFRRNGFGKQLVRQIEKEFLTYGVVSRFELFTGELSYYNINLYRGLGYSVFKSEPYNELYNVLYLEKNIEDNKTQSVKN